jgi:hypothetical protein
MAQRLNVSGDVSMGSRLFVAGDVSMAGRLLVNNVNTSTIFMSGGVQQFGAGSSAVPNQALGYYNMNGYVPYSNTGFTDVSLNGRLFLSGGITPNYSSPSLSSNQVGYVIAVNLSASTNSTGITTLSTISLTPGVWILSASIAINTGTGGQAAITSGANFSTGPGSGCVAITFNGSYYYPSITGVATVTTTTTYNLLFAANSAVSTTYNGPFTAVRIA